MPARGKHRHMKSNVITRGLIAAGTGEKANTASLQVPTGLADGLEVGSPLFRVRGNTPRGAGIAPVVPP